ncbi:gonadal protein gdl isoform X3 [Osmia bicornis bicornis]|uniref:gonadal protein gdl isoform X3 n=1 Tax=Osmia bicornis bicornis TaxID=1437191 RepID=UPI0010F7F5D4|nr:gonadal protein gdl isoform X3 [Osmia bicornis bicornis]
MEDYGFVFPDDKAMDVPAPTPQDLQRKLYFLVEQLQHMAGLMEIQHVTEKHLFQQRLQLLNQQKIEMQESSLSSISTEEERTAMKTALYKKHKDELKQLDMKLVLQLDQKVADQQSILEKAGVPGFYVTNNPIEIQVQMRLCDFIIRLSKMEVPS